jgi:hypothetical protein
MLVAHTSKGRGEAGDVNFMAGNLQIYGAAYPEVDNVVADALSQMFEGQFEEGSEINCATLGEPLPLVYS